MQKIRLPIKDMETGKTRKLDFVKFNNGQFWTWAKYQEALKRQLFRRAVINRFYGLEGTK